jgi:hypothetical protein
LQNQLCNARFNSNSNKAKYHEDFEKNIKNKCTSLADCPETIRAIENQKNASPAEYKGIKNQNGHQILVIEDHNNNKPPMAIAVNKDKKQVKIIKYKVSDFEQEIAAASNQFKLGSLNDYDPFSIESDVRQKRNIYQQPTMRAMEAEKSSGPYSLTSLNNNNNNNFASKFTSSNDYFRSNGDLVSSDISDDFVNRIARLNSDIKISVYKAIYDYDGKEEDELSFRDGDKFVSCEQIDVGWMIGVHEKSGKHGMFPSNYTEPIDFF